MRSRVPDGSIHTVAMPGAIDGGSLTDIRYPTESIGMSGFGDSRYQKISPVFGPAPKRSHRSAAVSFSSSSR
jgi:hypothetical protein